MAKPDGWAKAWGLAAHVEPAGCMTCGVRSAMGPQDVSKQIAPQGYGATNPLSPYCQQQLNSVYNGDRLRMEREDQLCGHKGGGKYIPVGQPVLGSGVHEGRTDVGNPSNGVIRFALARQREIQPFSRDSITAHQSATSITVNGQDYYLLASSEGSFLYPIEGRNSNMYDIGYSATLSVRPGIYTISSGVVRTNAYNSSDVQFTARTISVSVSVPSGGAVDILIDNNALQPPRLMSPQAMASYAPTTRAPSTIPTTSKNFHPAKGIWYK